jgi:hypothetical protein
MNNHPHLETLKARHREIDTRIQSEARRPGSDDMEVAQLKKEKLRLKEEIHEFEGAVA